MKRVIKRYRNRKLYDTMVHHYVTVYDVLGYINAGQDVLIIEVKTGKDVTKRILAEAIHMFKQQNELYNYNDVLAQAKDLIKNKNADVFQTFVMNEEK